MVVANAIAGLWALAAHRWPSVRSKALWWFTLAAQLTLFVEVALGAYMVGAQKYPNLEFHSFYGFLTIIAVAILYSYRRQLASRVYLLYGFGSLFIAGLSIRAMTLSA